jgi:hypothetical protein
MQFFFQKKIKKSHLNCPVFRTDDRFLGQQGNMIDFYFLICYG